MQHTHSNQPSSNQQGAALVIALIMLVILTILAFTGINTATTELALAGNEQPRRNASDAAAAGIEQSIAEIASVNTTPGSTAEIGPTTLGAAPIEYAAETRYVGDETGLPQSSAEKFIGLHFEIESTGTSARNGRDVQTQGVLVVASTGGAGNTSLGQLGDGLEGEDLE
jgi:type IV pilus assembly protein PilX